MALHRHLATAIVCSFVLFVAILLDQPFLNYNTSLQERNQTVVGRIQSIIPLLSPDNRVAVSFHDHGSSPKVTPRIVPRMDLDGSDDDDVMEIDSDLEDDDGHPTDALRLYNDAVFKGNQHRCLMNANLRQAADMVA